MEPIKSQAEYDVVFAHMVNMTVRAVKCDRATAERRMKALLASGLLDAGSADNPQSQMLIDKWMFGEIGETVSK